jgi:hypothetical protein
VDIVNLFEYIKYRNFSMAQTVPHQSIDEIVATASRETNLYPLFTVHNADWSFELLCHRFNDYTIQKWRNIINQSRSDCLLRKAHAHAADDGKCGWSAATTA